MRGISIPFHRRTHEKSHIGERTLASNKCNKNVGEELSANFRIQGNKKICIIINAMHWRFYFTFYLLLMFGVALFFVFFKEIKKEVFVWQRQKRKQLQGRSVWQFQIFVAFFRILIWMVSLQRALHFDTQFICHLVLRGKLFDKHFWGAKTIPKNYT